MLKYSFVIFVYLAAVTSVSANDNDYDICSTAGVFHGLNNKFMTGITSHILTRKKILNNPECISKYNSAVKLGLSLVAGDNINGIKNIQIINHANDFRDKVYEAISTKIGY